jgi:hypothetical protein
MDGRLRIVGGGLLATVTAVAVVASLLAAEEDRAPGAGAGSAPPTTSPTATERPGPPVLRPNMRSLGARDLQVEVDGDTRRLRFAAHLANLGPGPLVLQPRGRGRCEAGEHAAVQEVHVDVDGDRSFRRGVDGRRTREFSGCMARHPGHDHWHFDAMAAYSLRRPDADRVLVARDKVSFCLRDNQRVPGRPVPARRRHFGDCTATTAQGISPGWVDVYGADLDGQWLRLPRQVDGELLCLDLTADPDDLIAEADEADNGTSVAIRVQGSTVRRLAPARCR